ncbi:MAG: hypothetical protein IJS61_06970 [Firmicutes bacterium]|nr:hypothetical protein [Bacillota bacterium]
MNDNIFYIATMIEYVARVSKNHRGYIAKCLGEKGINHELDAAAVNHCLSYEQVCDEWIHRYGIETGEFETVENCKYNVPPVTAIGRVYQNLIVYDMKEKAVDAVKGILNVFTSFISDKISDFNTATYYSSPNYLQCSYDEGVLLN